MTARIRDRTHLDDLVLAALATGRRDGYEVLHELEARVDGVRGISPSTVFRTLHRLARNRLVARSTADPRRYRLTATGTRSLAGRTTAARDFADALDAMQVPAVSR
jgi:PadR family transcriptional regulator, regulatory protein PadR